jgi:nicotinamidase-related amidase
MHALLIIDMQIALVTGAYQEADTIEAINRAIFKSRKSSQPIFFIQHNHQDFAPLKQGADTWHVHPDLDTTP